MLREQRSRSQILFGYLPGQTVDLRGRIWKVEGWDQTRRHDVDQDALRRELLRLAGAWKGKDDGFVQKLRAGRGVQIVALASATSVRVSPFPDLWMCRVCGRYSPRDGGRCNAPGCQGRLGQLPFVGFHECGELRSPYVRSCPKHNAVRIVLPGTASADEIKFVCPVCGDLLRRGFTGPQCPCGVGRLEFNVHRAASVFTARNVVLVNPPSQEDVRRLDRPPVELRARLDWVVSGMQERVATDVKVGSSALKQQLIDSGLSEELATQLSNQAAASGELGTGQPPSIELRGDIRSTAEEGAVTLAYAVSTSAAHGSPTWLLVAKRSPHRASSTAIRIQGPSSPLVWKV